MALVKCRECSKEVSSSASKCPHCGIRSPSVSPAKGCLFIIILAVVFTVAIATCSNNSDRETPIDTHAPITQPVAEPEEIAQLPDLTSAEVLQYVNTIDKEIGEYLNELLAQHIKLDEPEYGSEFNLWRGKEWQPKVDAANDKYMLILNQHRKQLLLTPMRRVFNLNQSIQLASLNLIRNIDGETSPEKIELFKVKVAEIVTAIKEGREWVKEKG